MTQVKNVIPINARAENIHRSFLDDLEKTLKEFRVVEKRLQKLSDNAIKKIEKSVKDDTISAYRLALALGVLSKNLVSQTMAKVALYDRLSGIAGQYGSFEDQEKDEDDLEHQRMAEQMTHAMVKKEVEEQRRLRGA